jgi:flagellar biosynthetic protein FlhB
MAERDPSRTEKPTPKRLGKARDQGSVPKSNELTKGVILLVALIALYIFMSYIGRQLMTVFISFFKACMGFSATPEEVYNMLLEVAIILAKMLLPFLCVLAFTAYLTLRLQIGPLWTTQHMFKFNLSKHFNLIAGLKRLLISPQALVRLARSLAQAIIIAIAPYIVLKREFGNMAPLFYQNAEGIAAYILGSGATMVKYTLGPILAIGIADLLYVRWDYTENLKMTKFEVKDERKQAEGDPLIKNKMKQEMMKVMAQRMLEQVPRADVVVTNPTHVAVALRYDVLEAPAPMVLAKGLDHLAEKIKEVAREHGVPIRENAPLARALYKSVEVGEAIPEEFYKAVASLLAKLQKFKRGA